MQLEVRVIVRLKARPDQKVAEVNVVVAIDLIFVLIMDPNKLGTNIEKISSKEDALRPTGFRPIAIEKCVASGAYIAITLREKPASLRDVKRALMHSSLLNIYTVNRQSVPVCQQ